MLSGIPRNLCCQMVAEIDIWPIVTYLQRYSYFSCKISVFRL